MGFPVCPLPPTESKKMAKYLKRCQDVGAIAASDAKTRATVEGILADVEARGDDAVREYSQKFDNWSPKGFRLSDRDIETALSNVSARDLEDIKFAQANVRNFAEHQRSSMTDIEVETQPGIFLGCFPCENFKNVDFLNFNQKFYAIFASLGGKGFDT